ncbi:MAG: hypothetical protein IPN07_13035 [Dehalococcoidia bacterium]|nr:hypothetical protein [Dehalococcoidia bacterium]
MTTRWIGEEAATGGGDGGSVAPAAEGWSDWRMGAARPARSGDSSRATGSGVPEVPRAGGVAGGAGISNPARPVSGGSATAERRTMAAGPVSVRGEGAAPEVPLPVAFSIRMVGGGTGGARKGWPGGFGKASGRWHRHVRLPEFVPCLRSPGGRREAFWHRLRAAREDRSGSCHRGDGSWCGCLGDDALRRGGRPDVARDRSNMVFSCWCKLSHGRSFSGESGRAIRARANGSRCSVGLGCSGGIIRWKRGWHDVFVFGGSWRRDGLDSVRDKQWSWPSRCHRRTNGFCGRGRGSLAAAFSQAIRPSRSPASLGSILVRLVRRSMLAAAGQPGARRPAKPRSQQAP